MTTNTPPSPMRLLKFSSRQCAACLHMAKVKLLERFTTLHPEVKVIALDCVDDEGDTPRGSDFDKNMKLSDVYGVDSFPTLVFEGEGGELASWEGGAQMNDLEKTYRAAKERLEAANEIKARYP